MNNIEDFKYLNNLSEIILLSQSDNFKKLLDKIDNSIKIEINNHLIHKQNSISHYEQLIFNLDNYINFLKNNLFINPQEIIIIASLTIYNRFNNILFDKTYYYNNYNKYYLGYINMFMYNYKKNIKFLKRYINIKEKSFDELIKTLNDNKKKSYIYFEYINKYNMNFYLPILCFLEKINL